MSSRVKNLEKYTKEVRTDLHQLFIFHSFLTITPYTP